MFKEISVLGAGIMGSGIAQVIANADMDVSLYDIEENNLTKAMETIESDLNKLVEQNYLEAEKVPGILSKITCTMDLEESLTGSDFIFEVVPENLALKQSLYQTIEATVSEETIIASNTSAIPLSELTEKATKPSRFIIVHFMNPAPLVPLVEVITTEQTSTQVIEQTMDFVRQIEKSPVQLKKEIPGAVVNRLQAALLREAFHLVEEGVVTLKDIDEIVREGPGFRWGFIGPMQMVDLGGIDTWGTIMNHLSPELNRSTQASSIINDLVKSGKFGVKVGEGIYDYTNEQIEQMTEERDNNFIQMLKLKRKSNTFAT